MATALVHTIPVLFQHHGPCSLYRLSGDRITSFSQSLQPTAAERETKRHTGVPAAPTPAGWDFRKCSPWVVFEVKNLI